MSSGFWTLLKLDLFNDVIQLTVRGGPGLTQKLRRGMTQLNSIAGLLRPARASKSSCEQWEKTTGSMKGHEILSVDIGCIYIYLYTK